MISSQSTRKQELSYSRSRSRSRSNQKKKSKKEFYNSRSQAIKQILGYSADSNPFGDHNIAEELKWKKQSQKSQSKSRIQKQNFMTENTKIQDINFFIQDLKLIKKMKNQKLEEQKYKEKLIQKNNDKLKRQEKEEINKTNFKQQVERMQIFLRPLIRIQQKREIKFDLLYKAFYQFSQSFQTILKDTSKGYNKEENNVDNYLGHTIFIDNLKNYICELINRVKNRQNNHITQQSLEDVIQNIKEFVESLENVQKIKEKDRQFWKFLLKIHELARDLQKDGHLKNNCEDIIELLEQNNGNLQELKQHAENIIGSNDQQTLYDIEFWNIIAKLADLKINQQQFEDLVSSFSSIDLKIQLIPSFEKDFNTCTKAKNEIKPNSESNCSNANYHQINDNNKLNWKEIKSLSPYFFDSQFQGGVSQPQYSCKEIQGFDWNKYNKAHYNKDENNLPPKYVKGYRIQVNFGLNQNNPHSIPNYELLQIPKRFEQEIEFRNRLNICDQKGYDFQKIILKISPGKNDINYQNLYFPIVLKEWNTQKQSNFRCQMSAQGLFTLDFDFKRVSYKR